jgi:hypothetical protein
MELCNTPNVLEMTSTQNFLARFGFISKGISSRKRKTRQINAFDSKTRYSRLGRKKIVSSIGRFKIYQ